MKRPAMTRRLYARSAASRRGAITVLAAFFSIVALAMVAFSVDVGYILSSQQELQRAADAAALAACWEFGSEIADEEVEGVAMIAGRNAAAAYANLNKVAGHGMLVDSNVANTTTGDMVFGEIPDLYAPNATPDPNGAGQYNGVRLRLRCDQNLNGEVGLFFARIFGRSGQSLEAEATAGFLKHVSGFEMPYDGSNLGLLPFALDEDTYNDLMAGNADDDYRYDAATGTVSSGSDNVREVNLFPQGTGSPGNRGTVDIGSSNNSTSDIARQIVSGISASDLSYHNGKLEFDSNGELELNGDTGISAGVKDELASIIGQPRMIPVFAQVHGPGNNAQFTIVKWIGIRIVGVKLTGPMKKKHVTIQLAPYVTLGAIPGDAGDSDHIYSPVVLVR